MSDVLTEPITHATLLKRDLAYDPCAHQASMAITLHFADGSTVESMLVITPDQVELYRIQLEQAIAKREDR